MTVLANIFLEGAALLVAGAGLGYWLWRWKERNLRAALAIKEATTLESARREAEAIRREARLSASEEALKLRHQIEQSFADRRCELEETARRLNEREGLINNQLERMVQDENLLREQKQACHMQAAGLENERRELAELARLRREQLQSLSHVAPAEARALFLKEIENEASSDAARLTHRILDAAKSQAEERARDILSIAIQRYAGEYTFENTSATVALNGDDLKGRIIGREGRNIRAFEAATGVTVLIDDTPNAVVLSGFDPVRREIAREAMHRLILDGRIHPTRIEEVVAKVYQEMDETILRAGEQAVRELNLPPPHPEIIKLLGRLRFRQSFSQNLLAHAIEVAHLAGLMAAELGLEVTAAKRAGLFHDIGKAVNHEVEGPHALVGAEILKRYGEPDRVVNAVASHHEEASHDGPLGILISAADAISASRPGARSETMTTYIKRVEDLESVGLSFAGVEKCFAVQAGRELRVLVKPDQVKDDEAFILARNIARKIEEALHYPGQIRVTVMRETRCVEYAK